MNTTSKNSENRRKPEKTLINDMTTGPVLATLARFAVPIMLANLLQAVYSMVDMVVVGRFCGAAGLSAVGIGGQLLTLFLTIGMGFSNGAQTVISQQVGMKSQRISRTIGTLLSTILILAVAAGAVGIIFHNHILRFMNTSDAAWHQAVNYLVICCCGMVFIYGYNALCAVLRGMGESRLPLLFVAVASVINVFLDLLLVGCFHMEAAGAALATVLSQGVSFLCAGAYLYRHREAVGFDFHLQSFRIDGEQLVALCRLGIPFVVQQFLITGSITFINAQVNAFGVAASAVDSVGGKLNSVMNIVTGSISAATSTMIGQCFAARKMDRVKQTYWSCFVINMIWFAILSACYLLMPEKIFGCFTDDAAVVGLAPTYLQLAVVWLFALCTMTAPFALVNGIGFASFNLVVGLLDGVVARIGLSLLLGHLMGLPGYWLGNALAGFVTTIPMTFYFFTGRWMRREAVTK